LNDTLPNKSLHPSATDGFGSGASSYERGRPGYPAPLLVALRANLGLSAASRVIDLGAGTGKFTKLLAPYATVAAVEPVAAMRSVLIQSRLSIEILEGTAESIPVDDGGADAVVVAQAFHWFSRAEALREIHRVLAPNGKLALVWNLRDETTDWVAELMDTIRPFEGDTPRYTSGAWKSVFEDQTWFKLESHQTWQHFEEQSIEDVLAHVASISYVSNLKRKERKMVLSTIERRLKHRHPQGRLSFPYISDLWCFNRCEIAGDQTI